jgi:hypothetical protein
MRERKKILGRDSQFFKQEKILGGPLQGTPTEREGLEQLTSS